MRPGMNANGWTEKTGASGARVRQFGRTRRSQQGYTLLIASGLVALMASVAIGSQWVRSVALGQGQELTRINAMDAASRMLTTYAAMNGRLPCPASRRGGAEDCASDTQKGWLPVTTIAPQAADASALLAIDQVRYVVQRHGRDLTSADASMRVSWSSPGGPSWVPNPPSTRSLSASGSGSSDLCGKLVGAAAALRPLAPSRELAADGDAFVRTPGKDIRVAFALAPAVQGVSASDSLAAQPGFELSAPSTQTATDAEVTSMSAFGQQVAFADFHDLGESLQCSALYRSFDAIAGAADRNDGVELGRQNNVFMTSRDMGQNGQSMIADILLCSIDAIDLVVGPWKTLQILTNPKDERAQAIAKAAEHLQGWGITMSAAAANLVRITNDTWLTAESSKILLRTLTHEVWQDGMGYLNATYRTGAAFDNQGGPQ